MYNATKWLDKVVDVDSGEVIQAGTDQSAAHFNNMESGITDASVAAAMLLIAAGELQSQTEIERHVVELKNTASYPFNNSTKTVSLAITRDNTDYTVDVDIQAHTGNVGEIQIYDKQLNGFKVKYDGSAESATLILRIKGGRKKILSPSHRFRSFIFSFSTHSRIPSSHSIGSPVNPSAVYSDIYSTTSSPYTNVTIPLYFQEVNV